MVAPATQPECGASTAGGVARSFSAEHPQVAGGAGGSPWAKLRRRVGAPEQGTLRDERVVADRGVPKLDDRRGGGAVDLQRGRAVCAHPEAGPAVSVPADAG